MAGKALPFKSLLLFFSRILLRKLRNPSSRSSSLHRKPSIKLQRYPSLRSSTDFSKNQTLIFDVEGFLLKSSSIFPYFMLVAFEAGGLLRAFLLLLLYPFICLVDEEMGLQIMVMICFFGIKKESFRVGRAVLPKFFLEDVGLEGFEVLMRSRRKVGVSEMPRIMIDGFLKEYLKVDFVVGRELKVFHGYYVGLMEDKKKSSGLVLEQIFGEDDDINHNINKERLMVNNKDYHDVVGIGTINKPLDHHLFSHCKEIYMVNEFDKRSWHHLPKNKYPTPLIFHDGRLALKPTPLNSLSIFMWLPIALPLAIIRAFIALSLPYTISVPILALMGLSFKVSKPQNPLNPPTKSTRAPQPKGGHLYVCNHRTLLDPLYIAASLNRPMTAVTYSLSRVSEILAPIKTVRLTRDRSRDGKMMEKLLSVGDLIVCPEGTTCREPYLLRFSPLFAEMSDEIIPVAMNAHVSMFYGTTAGGYKCLDPLFFLMNPFPFYEVNLLEKVSGTSTCQDGNGEVDQAAKRFEVANHVQSELGKALGFECTKLTRKDKYLILAGNEGIVTAK